MSTPGPPPRASMDEIRDRLGSLPPDVREEVSVKEILDTFNGPPDWDGQEDKFIDRNTSKEIYVHTLDHTNSETAEHFGISESTVERHRAFWTNGDSNRRPSFERGKAVTEGLCKLWRVLAHHGDSMGAIADMTGHNRNTVFRHVSATSDGCQHDDRVDVERFDFSSKY